MSPVCAVRLLLLLLLGASATAQQVTDINYTPVVTAQSLEAKITSSTFLLDMPICIFGQNNNINAGDSVWLVVSTSKDSFVASTFDITNRPAFQDFLKSTTFYLTLKTQADSIPCDTDTSVIRVLRVGKDAVCATDRSQPDCNGPLTPPGPYRVKFLVIDPANAVKAQTLWSGDITLKTAKSSTSIDTGIAGRSGGMIALTTILSILLAILLALMIAILVYGWSYFGRLPTVSRSGLYNIGSYGSMRVSAYNTHMSPAVVAINPMP